MYIELTSGRTKDSKTYVVVVVVRSAAKYCTVSCGPQEMLCDKKLRLVARTGDAPNLRL